MQVLAVDIGTGTQDIYLYDSQLDLENGYKMVAPSPTMIYRRRIQQATREGRAVVLSGVLMGGGPLVWAAEDHLRAGLPLWATPDAARTFDDDLEVVEHKWGVYLVSEEEAEAISGEPLRLCLADLDYGSIVAAFDQFGFCLQPDLLAVAVFDHGEAPPRVSDREFRFDYLVRRIKTTNRLSAFAFRAEEIPPALTRLKAVAASAASTAQAQVMVMDTAPAAVLGATLDPQVARRIAGTGALVANLGNMHTLVFRLASSGIEGVLEHHTGQLTCGRLDDLIERLAQGCLTHQEVFDDHGHGALLRVASSLSHPAGEWRVAVAGPRRSLMESSRHCLYQAVPAGDMMMAGCLGMLCALPDVYPELAEPVVASLTGRPGRPPWELRG
jgi:uncharacterized protein (DUF1786 family)